MRPIILDYQIQRKDVSRELTKNQFYDPLKGLTVVIENNLSVPLIEANGTNLNDGTSTRMQREQDDFDSFLLLSTETKVAREQSDRTFDLLELKTKTFTKTEADDNHLTDYK